MQPIRDNASRRFSSTPHIHWKLQARAGDGAGKWCEMQENFPAMLLCIFLSFIFTCTISYTRSISESDLNFEDKFFNETLMKFFFLRTSSTKK